MSKHTQHIALQQYLNALLDEEIGPAQQRSVSSAAVMPVFDETKPETAVLLANLPVREPLIS